LEAYSRLSDVYRGLQFPQKELIATEKAFVRARHLNDDEARTTLLDQRLRQLRAKDLAKGRLAERASAEKAEAVRGDDLR